MRRLLEFLKTTALGGVVFLLPVIFVGVVVGQVVPIVISGGEAVFGQLPDHSPSGISIAVALALLFVLLLCFVAGLLARLSFGRRIGEWVERQLLLLFPRYAIVRDQMADNVGGEATKPRSKPVLVTFDDHCRVGLESDRSDDWVAVYLPTSPDAWTGHVVYVEPSRVRPLAVEYSEAVATCERLGRETVAVLFPVPAVEPSEASSVDSRTPAGPA